MSKTVTFVTNQFCCDRIIEAARVVADDTKTDLVVVGVLDSEYELDPEVVDYLFSLSKRNKATMRLLFSDDKMASMIEAVSQTDCVNVITGMPNDAGSVLYQLWKLFPHRNFYTVDANGEIVEVASSRVIA